MYDRVRSPVSAVVGEDGHSVRMLFLIFAGWSIVQTVPNVIPPLLPLVINDLNITPFVAGTSLTAMNALYAVALFPSGQLSDRLSRLTPIAASLVVLAVGTVIIGLATTMHAFVVGLCVFGLAKAFYVIPTRALVSDLFEARRGRALGIVTVGSDLGGVVAGGAAFVALGVGSWRTPFLPLAGLLVVALVMFHMWSRDTYVLATPRVEVRKPLSRVLRDGRLRRLVIAYALFWFAGLSVLNFLPVFLQATKSVSLAQATSLFALLFLTGMVAKPLGGSLSDRVSRIWVSAGALLLSVLALGLILLANSLPVIAVGVIVFAVGWKIQPPVVEALLMDISLDAHVGSDLGVAKSLSFGIGSFGPAYIGYMAETYGYAVGFSGLLGCLLLSVLLLFTLSRDPTVG